MTLQRLLDDLHRLGLQDAALGKEIDLETLLDYCAIANLSGAKQIYIDLLFRKGDHDRQGAD